MLRRLIPRKNEIDEHDQPTEPIPHPVILPAPPSVNYDPTVPVDDTLPIPPGQTFSPPQKRSWWKKKPSLYSPPANVYPYLPPPSGNTAYKPRPQKYKPIPQMEPEDQPVRRSRRRRRSGIPALVGFFFVVAQLLLLASFVLRILPLSDNPWWLTLIEACDDALIQPLLLIQPVSSFLQQLNLSSTFVTEIYTLLAILVYGILARIVVSILKMIWR